MKKSARFSEERFELAPVVGIARGYGTETVLKVAEAYRAAGLTTLEVTMNSPDIGETLALLRQNFPKLNIGAGTVCTQNDLKLALDSGAQFIVTPIVAEAVIADCRRAGVPVFPGAFTPTEIYRAWSLGATAVKVFPAANLGISYLRNVLGPLDAIRLLPTGGVDLDNIADWFQAGAVGVGMGSSLLDKRLIREGKFKALEAHFRAVLAAAVGGRS